MDNSIAFTMESSNKNVDQIYDQDTLISSHTNRPITNPPDNTSIASTDNTNENIVGTDGSEYIFWCTVCEYKMDSVRRAILHMGGKYHRRRKTEKEEEQQMQKTIELAENESEKSLKRELDSSTDNDGNSCKKSRNDIKRDFEQRLICEDCNMRFETTLLAIQHLKGKKHALTVTKKLETKKEHERKRNKSTSPVYTSVANRFSFPRTNSVKDSKVVLNQKPILSSPMNHDVMNKTVQLRQPYSITIPGSYPVRNTMNLQPQPVLNSMTLQQQGPTIPSPTLAPPPNMCSLPQSMYGVLGQPFYPTPTPPINLMNTTFTGQGYHWAPT